MPGWCNPARTIPFFSPGAAYPIRSNARGVTHTAEKQTLFAQGMPQSCIVPEEG